MLDSDDRAAMASYIAAAERYFQELDQPQRLFAKPFVPQQDAAYNVARLGVLLHHLDHHRPHTVLDFGAGMCWLTAVLLHNGCRVVALDVSTTALRLGEEAVARAHGPATRQRVRYLTYDGFAIPLDDASVDRIACYDALHHVPNKTTVLREMYRVLRPGGRVCFAEPGPGHAGSAVSLEEAHTYGVLEDEVDAPALCAVAAEIGFSWSSIVPFPWLADNVLTAPQFATLRHGNRERALTWSGNDALIVLGKGAPETRDSRSPGLLRADVRVVQCPDEVARGEVFTVDLAVTNTGDTRWLALPAETAGERLDYAATFLQPFEADALGHPDASVPAYRRFIDRHALEGYVTIGAQRWAIGSDTPADRDYGRGFLSQDVEPGQQARVTVTVRAPGDGGLFHVSFDPVAECVAWFAQRGSSVAHRYVRLEPGAPLLDSRAPGRLGAAIDVVSQTSAGPVAVSLTNTGDTTWLAHPLPEGGWVRLGLQTIAADGRMLDREWRRVALPRDVGPGEAVVVAVDLSGAPASATHVRLDLVDELRCWFSDVGADALTVALEPRAKTSDPR